METMCTLDPNRWKGCKETIHFCRMFNKFFDVLNTRFLLEGKQKRNENLDPYKSIDDGRLKVGMHCTDTYMYIMGVQYIRYFVYFYMHAVAKR